MHQFLVISADMFWCSPSDSEQNIHTCI